MAESYNVVAELDATFGEENADALLGPIAKYSGGAARSELGHAEVVFTIRRITSSAPRPSRSRGWSASAMSYPAPSHSSGAGEREPSRSGRYAPGPESGLAAADFVAVAVGLCVGHGLKALNALLTAIGPDRDRLAPGWPA